jgi:FMN phosphatase YigB (HAD superfamily)
MNTGATEKSMFPACLRKLKEAAGIINVDKPARDVSGARSAGMTAVFLSNPRELIDPGDETQAPDIIIDDIAGILALIASAGRNVPDVSKIHEERTTNWVFQL